MATAAEECSKCGDTGIWEFKPGDATQCPCRLDDIARRAQNRMRRGIPDCFHKAAWERNPIRLFDKKVLRAMHAYVATFDAEARSGAKRGPSIWLNGPIGTGKSTAAGLIALEAGRLGYDITWWGMSKLLLRIRATYTPGSDARETAWDLLQEMDKHDLLVLDDIATVNATDHSREVFYLIINERYENNRPIVLTADVDLERMGEAIGERTVSRLYQMTGGEPINFSGPDHRFGEARHRTDGVALPSDAAVKLR